MCPSPAPCRKSCLACSRAWYEDEAQRLALCLMEFLGYRLSPSKTKNNETTCRSYGKWSYSCRCRIGIKFQFLPRSDRLKCRVVGFTVSKLFHLCSLHFFGLKSWTRLTMSVTWVNCIANKPSLLASPVPGPRFLIATLQLARVFLVQPPRGASAPLYQVLRGIWFVPAHLMLSRIEDQSVERW